MESVTISATTDTRTPLNDVVVFDGRAIKRPPRNNVKTHGLFFRACDFERRVLGMLINEVGAKRYEDLIRIAAMDIGTKDGYAPQKSVYYASADKDIDVLIPATIRQANEEHNKRRLELKQSAEHHPRTYNNTDRHSNLAQTLLYTGKLPPVTISCTTGVNENTEDEDDTE